MPIIIPYNANLGAYATKLRKAGNLSEVILWNQLKRRKMNELDFDRQRIIGNYIVAMLSLHPLLQKPILERKCIFVAER